MNLRGARFRRVQDFSDEGEREFGSLNFDTAGCSYFRAYRNQQTRGVAAARLVEKLFILDVSNIALACGIQRRHSMNNNVGAAGHYPADEVGKFSDCLG